MVTQRDKVWAETLRFIEFRRSFQASEIKECIETNPPSERTVRNTLDALVSLGYLRSDGGSGRSPRIYYPREIDPTENVGGYTPRESNQTGTFPYPGSKDHLAEWIIDTMPTHDTYVEVFGGAAGVLFSKPRSKYEIYNDINEDLTQFFKILRDRPDELAEWLQNVPYSRSQYQEWIAEFYQGIRPDDPVERAGRYFSLRYMQYLGVSDSPNSFKARAKRSPARTFDNAKKRLQALADRFQQVTIEKQDYRKIFSNYDDTSIDVLFYADPPYIGAEQRYMEEFDHEDFVDCLEGVDSDWIVSYSTIPEKLEGNTVLEQQNRHRMRRDADEVNERLICNFDPDERANFRNNIDT
ncbi:DNA adenine methylase [Halosimplex halobium]|uniref:DNA adenine methylase n=1 Tax=Halosimplex halobium TaxID=3396618 RepID=UPI003F55F4F9